MMTWIGCLAFASWLEGWGLAFALRKYLKDGGRGVSPVLLEKGKAMTCVDELLRLFCEDH